jgi:hypothetical protein
MNSSDININTVRPTRVTIWHHHIGELIKKKDKLSDADEKELRKMNRFHLERFHFHRHETRRNSNFDSIDYSRFSLEGLIKECCKEKV